MTLHESQEPHSQPDIHDFSPFHFSRTLTSFCNNSSKYISTITVHRCDIYVNARLAASKTQQSFSFARPLKRRKRLFVFYVVYRLRRHLVSDYIVFVRLHMPPTNSACPSFPLFVISRITIKVNWFKPFKLSHSRRISWNVCYLGQDNVELSIILQLRGNEGSGKGGSKALHSLFVSLVGRESGRIHQSCLIKELDSNVISSIANFLEQ